MPKTKQNKYRVAGITRESFAVAAGAAVDLSLRSGEAVAIEELSWRGELLSYVNVRADVERP